MERSLSTGSKRRLRGITLLEHGDNGLVLSWAVIAGTPLRLLRR